MTIEDRLALRRVGLRLLGALAIYFLVASFLLGVSLSIPFVREIMPDLQKAALSGSAPSQSEIMTRFQAFISSDPDRYYAAANWVSCVCAVLGALLFLPSLRHDHVTLRAHYAKPGISFALLPMLVAVAYGLNCLSSFAVLGTEWLFNRFGLTVLLPDEMTHSTAYYVYAVLLAPLCEEFMFRGGALRSLKPFGERFALIASSLCFAFFHGNLHQFPGTFLMGLWFGYIYLRSGSLLMPTLTHMGLNLLVILLNALTDTVPSAAIVSFVLFLGVGYWCLRRLYPALGPVAPADAPRPVSLAFYASFPMLLYLTTCLYHMVTSVAPLS